MCLGEDLSRLHRKGRRQFHVLNLSGDDLGVSGLSQPDLSLGHGGSL